MNANAVPKFKSQIILAGDVANKLREKGEESL